MAPAFSNPDRAVLLTRPLEDSRRTAARLAEEGIASEIWPLTRVVPAMTLPPLPATMDGLIVTSGNGLSAFAALTGRRDLPVLAVGARTAEVARRLGFAAVLSAEGDARALADLARRAGLRHLFYPRGREVSAVLPALLGAGGPRLSEAVVYCTEETGPPPAPVAHALAAGRIGAVTVWSARNAAILARYLSQRPPAAGVPPIVAISSKAAAPLAEAGFGDIVVAARPDLPAMVEAVRRCLDHGARTR